MGKLVGAVGIELLDNFKPAAYQKELESIIGANSPRSEEHTSELQSRLHLVCRLLLEKKKAYACHAFLQSILSFALLITSRSNSSIIPSTLAIPNACGPTESLSIL